MVMMRTLMIVMVMHNDVYNDNNDVDDYDATDDFVDGSVDNYDDHEDVDTDINIDDVDEDVGDN